MADVTAPQRHRIASGIALSLAGTLVTMMAGEGLLRFTAYHRQFARHDATLGYVLTPDFERTVPIPEHPDGKVVFHTNNLGLRRDEPTAIPKPPDATRVLVLGDSQTEGIINNRDSYSSWLERALNTASGQSRKVEVLNAAVSGYSPLLEYLWLRERGRALQPDLVVLAIYVGNDLAELLMRHEDFGGFGPYFKIPFLRRAGRSWEIILPGSDGGILGRLDWLLQTRSRLYALAHRVLHRPPMSGTSSVAEVAHTCPGCLQSLWQAWVAQTRPAELAESLVMLDHLLEQFQRQAEQFHVPLLVVVVPTKLQVEAATVAADAQNAAHILGLRSASASSDEQVRGQLLALCTRRNIRAVDLLPPLQSAFADTRQPLFWAQDWHLNVRGHRVVAEYLLPILSEMLPAFAG